MFISSKTFQSIDMIEKRRCLLTKLVDHFNKNSVHTVTYNATCQDFKYDATLNRNLKCKRDRFESLSKFECTTVFFTFVETKTCKSYVK